MLITVGLIDAVNNLVKNDCTDLDKGKPFLILRGVPPSQHIHSCNAEIFQVSETEISDLCRFAAGFY